MQGSIIKQPALKSYKNPATIIKIYFLKIVETKNILILISNVLDLRKKMLIKVIKIERAL